MSFRIKDQYGEKDLLFIKYSKSCLFNNKYRSYRTRYDQNKINTQRICNWFHLLTSINRRHIFYICICSSSTMVFEYIMHIKTSHTNLLIIYSFHSKHNLTLIEAVILDWCIRTHKKLHEQIKKDISVKHFENKAKWKISSLFWNGVYLYSM